MHRSIDKITFDKRDDEPWGKYIDRKLSGLEGYLNDNHEYFDFREIFYDKDGAQIGYEFTLSLRYDHNSDILDNVKSLQCYCRAIEFRSPDDDQSLEDYSGDNLDEIKVRLQAFTERINVALGLTLSFDSLLKSYLGDTSEDEELLDMAEFRAWCESERLNEAAKAANRELTPGEGLSL